MSRVFATLSTSVDGYITGPDPSPEQALGHGGKPLFDWYFDGDVPSQVFEGFRLSAESARMFDQVAGRVGAVIAGRRTYDHSNGFGGDGGPHPTAPLVVLSHGPPPPGATQPLLPASRKRSRSPPGSQAIATSVSRAGRRPPRRSRRDCSRR
jgi:dihydrofolate reductase